MRVPFSLPSSRTGIPPSRRILASLLALSLVWPQSLGVAFPSSPSRGLLLVPESMRMGTVAAAPTFEVDLELDAPQEVVVTLEPFLEGKGTVATDARRFAYGHALHALGRNEEAARVLTDYRQSEGYLRNYASHLLGEVYLALRKPDMATSALELALKAFPSGRRGLEARLGLARALRQKQLNQEAVTALQTLLDDCGKSTLRYVVRLELAEAFLAAGQKTEAIAQLEWLWSRSPSVVEAEKAGEMLQALEHEAGSVYKGPGVRVLFRRAQELQDAGRVEQGLELMLELANTPAAKASLPDDLLYELGKAHFQAKRYKEALSYFERWHKMAPESKRQEALYWRGLTTGRMGDAEASIKLYESLAEAYPRGSYTEKALLKIGLLLIDEGQYARAEGAFLTYLERFPTTESAANARWYLAWTQLRQGLFAKASASYDRFVDRHPTSELVPGSYYWQGRMSLERKKSDEALHFFQKVARYPYPSHYGMLARIALERLGKPYAETKATGLSPEPPTLKPPLPELLERVSDLLRIGLREFAQDELGVYERSIKGRQELVALADWYYKTGHYKRALQLANRLGVGGDLPKLNDPSYTYRLTHPMAFQDHLAGVTVPEGLSWELLYAIMRQESLFSPYVTSSAGAKGLMQVINETALEVCTLRRLPAPVPRTLYRPEVSVQYGAWHLEDLTKRLQGRLPLVIAAYNAGPEAVERWLKERPVDPIDVFMEEISYGETRRYVRHVLTNLFVYSRLYGDGRTSLNNEPGLELSVIAAPRAKGSGGAKTDDGLE